jgi:hypothetical protein
MHGARYLSDPHGSLLFRLHTEAHLGRYRQGSHSAEMLICRNCGVLLGALYRDEQRLHGVVNANVLAERNAFASPQSVSPQRLTAEQKVQRWRELWFNVVRISADG